MFVTSLLDLVEIDTHIAKKAESNKYYVFDHVVVDGVDKRPWEINDRLHVWNDVDAYAYAHAYS